MKINTSRSSSSLRLIKGGIYRSDKNMRACKNTLHRVWVFSTVKTKSSTYMIHHITLSAAHKSKCAVKAYTVQELSEQYHITVNAMRHKLYNIRKEKGVTRAHILTPHQVLIVYTILGKPHTHFTKPSKK